MLQKGHMYNCCSLLGEGSPGTGPLGGGTSGVGAGMSGGGGTLNLRFLDDCFL